MYDLICIGDVVVDLYFKSSSFTVDKGRFSMAIGGKYISDFFHQGLGGGAANVAIDAASLELDTAVCALVGENAFKQIIIQHLVKKNVSTELLLFLPDFVNISSILLSENGEKTVIHFPTQNASFAVTDHMMTQLSEAKTYFVGHIPQATLKEKINLLEHIAGFKKPIFLNLGVDDCSLPLKELSPMLDQIDVLILNNFEFAQLIKKTPSEIDLNSDMAKLIGFDDKLLIITAAEKGSYAYNKNQTYFSKAVAIEKIVDTTGVGDAYTAAFIATFIKNPNIQEAMKAATAFAAKKLSRLGAN